MSSITTYFNKPYPLNESLKRRWINSLLFSSFVFLFLSVFQPFALNQLAGSILLVAFGYSFVCLSIMVILNIAIFATFPNYFSEHIWTTGREISWTMLNIFLIGLGNFLYSKAAAIIYFSWANLFWFELYTMAIGIFPIGVTILINQTRLNNKFGSQSQKLNLLIEHAETDIADSNSISIRISSENGSDEIDFLAEDFVFAKSDDNYVEINYLSEGNFSRKLIRNTLKYVSESMVNNQDFFRCHKSYLVNLKQVTHISGNAQGYKLHLTGTDDLVPVSRSHNHTIKQYFSKK